MFLVDKQSRKVLAIGEQNAAIAGEWADWVRTGRAVWVPDPGIPADEVAVAPDGSLSLDPAKKSAKNAGIAQRAAVLAAMRKPILSVSDAEDFRAAVVEWLGIKGV